MTVFERFGADLKAGGIAGLQSGLIGRDMDFEGPFGTRKMLYADFIASGRPMQQVEDFVAQQVLPFYANSHTEDSFCGQRITEMREAARAEIARMTNAGPGCHVIFAGSGATAGLNRVVGLLDITARVARGERIVILLGPYEHHSNDLPWRETGAEILQLGEAKAGGVDLAELASVLRAIGTADEIVGSFSAASNVTGILTDVDAVTRTLHEFGALSIWDYAGGAPYLPMDMDTPGAAKDAIVFSPHKFPGGPVASGIMIVRDTVVKRDTPTAPGGGTVEFVSPWRHAYLADVAAREEAGTPNVIGDIRVALTMLVKESAGCDWIAARDEILRHRLIKRWDGVANLRLLGGAMDANSLPFFSFQIADSHGQEVHPQLVTRILSDHLGIQARGGCACAGPYGHRLLGIDQKRSEELYQELRSGDLSHKPGWTRLNLSYLHSDDEAERIISGVLEVAARIDDLVALYEPVDQTGRFRARACLDATG